MLKRTENVEMKHHIKGRDIGYTLELQLGSSFEFEKKSAIGMNGLVISCSGEHFKVCIYVSNTLRHRLFIFFTGRGNMVENSMHC